MQSERNGVERGLELFRELVRESPAATRDLSASSAEFFGTEALPGDGDAALRHLEWYLFERHSEVLDGRPGEILLPAFRERSDSTLAGVGDTLLESRPGVFEVTGVRASSGIWLRDLASGGEYPLLEPEAASELSEGDLVVGRIYPVGEGCFRASPAAGCFRDSPLRAALLRDLEEAREARRGVPLVSQALLESMFFGSAGGEAKLGAQKAVAHAVAWLTENGVDPEKSEDIVAALRSAPFDPTTPLYGGNDVLGAILEDLAIDSDIDLEGARLTLLQTWSALWSKRPLQPENEPKRKVTSGDASRALENFDAGRARGENLEQLFDQLERELGFDGDEAEDDAETAPDFPGVVGAMVEEFLWEESSREPAREFLAKLAEFARPVGVFEEFGSDDLLAFGGCWLLEHGGLESGDDARRALEALGDFCRWAEEQHQVPLWTGFAPTLERLMDSLPRLVEANRHLERAAPGTRADLARILETRADAASVQVPSEPTTREVELPAQAVGQLRSGDWLRLRSEGTVVGAYPAESAPVLFAAS